MVAKAYGGVADIIRGNDIANRPTHTHTCIHIHLFCKVTQTVCGGGWQFRDKVCEMTITAFHRNHSFTIYHDFCVIMFSMYSIASTYIMVST